VPKQLLDTSRKILPFRFTKKWPYLCEQRIQNSLGPRRNRQKTMYCSTTELVYTSKEMHGVMNQPMIYWVRQHWKPHVCGPTVLCLDQHKVQKTPSIEGLWAAYCNCFDPSATTKVCCYQGCSINIITMYMYFRL